MILKSYLQFLRLFNLQKFIQRISQILNLVKVCLIKEINFFNYVLNLTFPGWSLLSARITNRGTWVW